MVDIEKLCEELYKDSKSSYQTRTIYFTVVYELEKKLTSEEFDEFIKISSAIVCKQKDNEGIFDISTQSNKD